MIIFHPNMIKNKIRIDIKKDMDLYNYLSNFPKDKEFSILDLACGTGNYLKTQIEFLKDFNIKWFGIDASKGMLDIAKEKNRKC